MINTGAVGSWEVISLAGLTGTLCDLRGLQNVNVQDSFPLFVPEFFWERGKEATPTPEPRSLL